MIDQSDLKQKEALTVAYEDINTNSFGLAPIKQEGKCLSFGHPEITPWDEYSNEFNEWFRISVPWYLKVFKNQMRASWEQALLINAQKGNTND